MSQMVRTSCAHFASVLPLAEAILSKVSLVLRMDLTTEFGSSDRFQLHSVSKIQLRRSETL